MVSLINDDKDEPPGIVGAMSSMDLSFSDAESDGVMETKTGKR